jgi:hypothetical protein
LKIEVYGVAPDAQNRVYHTVSHVIGPCPNVVPPSPTPILTNTPTKTLTPMPTNTPPPIPVSADANSDGKINGLDFVVWLINYNKNVTGPANGDFNGSSKVDIMDYVIWLKSYQK